MSLRERLQAKARRRVTVNVQVTDPADDARRAAEARVMLLAAQANPDRVDELPALERAVEEADDAVAAHMVAVEFEQLTDADFEAVVAAHTTDDGVDQDAVLPVLAAACAVDEDLQDEEWWAEQLDPTSGVWSPGERDHLYYKIYSELHYAIPSGVVPKG